MSWIPCSQSKPVVEYQYPDVSKELQIPVSTQVLIHETRHGMFHVARLKGADGPPAWYVESYGYFKLEEVSHWMPTPPLS